METNNSQNFATDYVTFQNLFEYSRSLECSLDNIEARFKRDEEAFTKIERRFRGLLPEIFEKDGVIPRLKTNENLIEKLEKENLLVKQVALLFFSSYLVSKVFNTSLEAVCLQTFPLFVIFKTLPEFFKTLIDDTKDCEYRQPIERNGNYWKF